MHLSPGIRDVEPYPFEELDRRKQEAVDAGRALVDFGVGDPRDETPAFIREALKAAVVPTSSYPRAAGLPELREAIVRWVDRRFGVSLDPATDLIPTLGSKEPIFSLAQAVLDPAAGRDLVVVTAPGYTIPERGARFAGRRRARGSRSRRPTSCPTSTAWAPTRGTARRSCGSTTRTTRPAPSRRSPSWSAPPTSRAATTSSSRSTRRTARCGSTAVRPPRRLELGDLTNVVVLNTLSKRSNMTGYRSGFMAGDPHLIAAAQGAPPVGRA